MQQEIRTIVSDVHSLTGLNGTLNFQADPFSFIEFIEDEHQIQIRGSNVGLSV